ncbi:hypothetical protein CLOM_g20944 [Closterium sp. NIES-68]|nr:hypothetical protein CLOM_g20944 [Closterium sp. NIES-68]GJP80997.1 hypothetical protein CLOP_g11182 [Closterium sp. NIES-67]
MCQLGINSLDRPSRKAVVRIRTWDRSLAIRCDAGKPFKPAEAPKAEVADSGIEGRFESSSALMAGTEIGIHSFGEEAVDRRGGEGEGSVRLVGGGEAGDKEGGHKRSGGRAGKAAGSKSEGAERRTRGRGEREEEEKEEEVAVALIAQALMEKFGPQIVRGELEESPGNGRNAHDIRGGGLQEYRADTEAEGEDQGEEEAKRNRSEKDSSIITSRSAPTTTPHPYARATSPSSLRSLYRFFSSQLGISSSSTVASLLASHPALLRSDPTTDLLPRVRLLQSYGVCQADMVHATMTNASWLRTSLPQIREMLEFLLA